jgi:beta-N-acetylhexosaminidase
LGEGNLDSHHDLPVIQKSFKKMWSEDLAPYRALRREFPFVMVSHAAYPQVTREKTPASLSRKWITEVLRNKIGYRGLIASDDMEMGGVLAAAPIEQAAVEHIRAGGDLCLICHKEEFVNRACEELRRTAERDPKFDRRVRESTRRVLAFNKEPGTMGESTHKRRRRSTVTQALGIWRAGSIGRLVRVCSGDTSICHSTAMCPSFEVAW